MYIIEKLKNLFKIAPVEPDLIHPYFGPIYQAVKGDDGFWCTLGKNTFKPLSLDIEVIINIGNEGPNYRQVEFHKWFLTNYENELKRASKAIINHIELGTNEKIKGAFFECFRFCTLTIPKDGNINNQWEIAFLDLTDKHSHVYSVEFTKNKIHNIRMDG